MPTVYIENDKQWIKVARVLREVGDMYHAVGPVERPRLIVTQRQYQALVDAKLVPADGSEAKESGTKTTSENVS